MYKTGTWRPGAPSQGPSGFCQSSTKAFAELPPDIFPRVKACRMWPAGGGGAGRKEGRPLAASRSGRREAGSPQLPCRAGPSRWGSRSPPHPARTGASQVPDILSFPPWHRGWSGFGALSLSSISSPAPRCPGLGDLPA